MRIWKSLSLRGERLALLALACCVLALALVGCDAAAAPGQTNSTNIIAITTPNPGQLTPTPTFPPFTVGAWPSNYSPNDKETITIYVFCRVQAAAMTGPSVPPAAGVSVALSFGDPIDKSATGTTDADGLAAIPFTVDDPHAGQPVTVSVSVGYGGQTYIARTFFTPNPTATPTPSVTVGPGTPTPTPGG